MNCDYIVRASISYNLSDAQEELAKILELMNFDKEFDDDKEDEFNVRMAHLYMHLNTAWNIRNISGIELESADSKQLHLWAEFPKDLKLL